ncbi:MAG: hypothetical protein DI586_02510 [Micavibrio aeruginosavorus]|uniref:Uncharacterized protein n=1 Tax=Micavibrio aeruginosavorus TaxID=349221 RepID=A0A2W5HF66_9BACT|nr:MAG: hypothetical protein DI586_02510 [Micavibrio aeruginosavorus]
MGSLTSALAPIIQVGSALGTVANAAAPFYKDSVDRKAQKASNELAVRQAQASAALQKEQNRLSALQQEQDRKRALRNAVARQRAEFGGSGIGSADGSSEAVLLGLFNESDDERAMRQQITNLRNNALDLTPAQIQQRNLLQQTQSREQDAINRITDFF